MFIIEGTRETERARAAGTTITEVFLCREYATAETRALAEHLDHDGVQITTTSARAFQKLSKRQHRTASLPWLPCGVLRSQGWHGISPSQLNPSRNPATSEPCFGQPMLPEPGS